MSKAIAILLIAAIFVVAGWAMMTVVGELVANSNSFVRDTGAR